MAECEHKTTLVTSMPDDCGETYGAWVNDPDGDGCLGVYAERGQGVVIGLHESHFDKVDCCDVAISLSPTGGISLQWHDDEGEIHIAAVDAAKLHRALSRLLRSLAYAAETSILATAEEV